MRVRGADEARRHRPTHRDDSRGPRKVEVVPVVAVVDGAVVARRKDDDLVLRRGAGQRRAVRGDGGLSVGTVHFVQEPGVWERDTVRGSSLTRVCFCVVALNCAQHYLRSTPYVRT